MNYVVFGLGILLTAAGSLSVYAGYDIIQVERGWTEVIAGSTAITGGIITIALGAVLQRLKALAELYETSSKPMTANLLSTLTLPSEAQIEAPTVDATQDAPFLSPNPNPTSTGFGKIAKPPVWQRASDPVIADTETETAGVSAIFADMTATALPKATALFDLPRESSKEPPRDLFEPGHAATPSPQSSPSALSLDEMWKRVSDEIEKPIFAPRTPSVFASTSFNLNSVEPLPAVPEATHPTPSSAQTYPAPESSDAQLEPEESRSDLSDWDAPISAVELSSLATPVEHISPTAHGDDVGLASHKSVGTSSAEAESSAQDTIVASAPASAHSIQAEPSVIGRYEAEGTAYLMFSDGSIEAQSEAGIFRFASMADLKAFIENKQAAEP